MLVAEGVTVSAGFSFKCDSVVTTTIDLLYSARSYCGSLLLYSGGGTQDCLSCNTELKRAVLECDTLYPPSSRINDHRECLSRTRSKYESCRAAYC